MQLVIMQTKTSPVELNPWEGFLIFSVVVVSCVETSRDLPLHAAETKHPMFRKHRMFDDIICRILYPHFDSSNRQNIKQVLRIHAQNKSSLTAIDINHIQIKYSGFGIDGQL